MAIPVIKTTTSILGYNQYQSWEYQPYATNTPTSWACPNLPAGLSIDTSTGLISGAATVAGVFNCGLTATNGDGTSAVLMLTIGISVASASAALLTNSGTQITIDVATKLVTVGSAAAVAPAPSLSSATDPRTSPALRPAPLLFARQNDGILLWISFVKGGVPLALTITAMELALKEMESGTRIILGNVMTQVGSGAGSYFGLFCDLSSASGLADMLANYQSDDGTSFAALAEIAWTETNTDSGSWSGSPASFNFSTQDFGIQIATDMAA